MSTSLNRLMICIKAAAANHKQIGSVVVGDLPKIPDGSVYPILRVWPGGQRVSNITGRKTVTFTFALAVMDRHENNDEQIVEVMSDSGLIILDLLSSLEYMYRDDENASEVEWIMDDEMTPVYDETGAVLGGYAVELQARVPFHSDFCSVPARNYDFPVSGLFDLQVIDSGGPADEYDSLFLIDGGIVE